eukprot:1094088-Prorocentrum_minimum.AAC.1
MIVTPLLVFTKNIYPARASPLGAYANRAVSVSSGDPPPWSPCMVCPWSPITSSSVFSCCPPGPPSASSRATSRPIRASVSASLARISAESTAWMWPAWSTPSPWPIRTSHCDRWRQVAGEREPAGVARSAVSRDVKKGSSFGVVTGCTTPVLAPSVLPTPPLCHPLVLQPCHHHTCAVNQTESLIEVTGLR